VRLLLEALGETSLEPVRLSLAVALEADLLREAIDSRAWPFDELDRAAEWAVIIGRVEALRMLIENGYDISESELPLVWQACRYGHEEMLRHLLRMGARVNGSEGHGGGLRRSIHEAIRSRDRACFELVLEAGADPAARGDDEENALHVAAETYQPQWFIERLAELGVPVDAGNDRGHTPLMRAVIHDNVPAIEALLEAGADPHVRDAEGRTALDYARGGLYVATWGPRAWEQMPYPAPRRVIEALERAMAEWE
jgi:ankyrin repeat protein